MRRKDRRWEIEKGCILIGETVMGAGVEFFLLKVRIQKTRRGTDKWKKVYIYRLMSLVEGAIGKGSHGH